MDTAIFLSISHNCKQAELKPAYEERLHWEYSCFAFGNTKNSLDLIGISGRINII